MMDIHFSLQKLVSIDKDEKHYKIFFFFFFGHKKHYKMLKQKKRYIFFGSLFRCIISITSSSICSSICYVTFKCLRNNIYQWLHFRKKINLSHIYVVFMLLHLLFTFIRSISSIIRVLRML